MKHYMRGEEWWVLRDDGSWARWDRHAMDWIAAPAPPPSELKEAGEGAPSSLVIPPPPVPEEMSTPMRRLARDRALTRSIHSTEAVLVTIIGALAIGALILVLRFFDMFW